MEKGQYQREEVLKYLQARPDVVVTLGELVDSTGLNRAQASSAISSLKKFVTIAYLGRGLYRYTPGDPQNPPRIEEGEEEAQQVELFELITELPDGRLLIKSDQGIAYFAVRA